MLQNDMYLLNKIFSYLPTEHYWGSEQVRILHKLALEIHWKIQRKWYKLIHRR